MKQKQFARGIGIMHMLYGGEYRPYIEPPQAPAKPTQPPPRITVAERRAMRRKRKQEAR